MIQPLLASLVRNSSALTLFLPVSWVILAASYFLSLDITSSGKPSQNTPAKTSLASSQRQFPKSRHQMFPTVLAATGNGLNHWAALLSLFHYQQNSTRPELELTQPSVLKNSWAQQEEHQEDG